MSITALDKDKIKQKYRAERDKRIRPEGNAQYKRLAEFEDLSDDPHMPVIERAPVTDHVKFAFIGGGFAGLVVGARLKKAGIDDVRIVEKGFQSYKIISIGSGNVTHCSLYTLIP